MSRYSSSNFFCGHCKKFLGKSTFYKHKRRFYNVSSGLWQLAEAVSTKTSTTRPSRSFTVIDPMHNLFLGTAKSMFKLWIEQNLLSKQDIQTMESRIKEFDVGTGLGRLPHKMSANYGCYTASQWKNWTLVYSLFVLNGLLPEEHM